MRQARILQGDILDRLPELEPESFDGCLCDPPYGLSSATPQGFANSAIRILSKVGLPDFEELEAGLSEKVDLAAIALDGSALSRRQLLAVGIEPGIGVPKGPVNLQHLAAIKQEVNARRESSAGVSEPHLAPVADSEDGEFLGDYVLDLRDAGQFSAGDILGGGLCQPLAGGVGMSVVTALLPDRACPLTSFLLSGETSGSYDVGPGDKAGNDASAPRSVVARTRAETRAVLRFYGGRGAFELHAAAPALNGELRSRPCSAKLIRALPRAGGLPAMAQAYLVRLVDGSAGRAPAHFRLWLRMGSAVHLASLAPPGGFMGREWDHGVPGPEVWRLVLRALKPGAVLMAFGGPRTYHRLACAIEDAGFEIRDSILVPGAAWVHGQGFPKSLDLAKALDRRAGERLEPIGERPMNDIRGGDFAGRGGKGGMTPVPFYAAEPVSEEARRWASYGTALKPAWEPIVVAMKPLAGTFAENALQHGVAGLNIDGSRIGTSKSIPANPSAAKGPAGLLPGLAADREGTSGFDPNVGRWPANLILVHHPECIHPDDEVHEAQLGFDSPSRSPTLAVRRLEAGCHPDCPVAELDRQSGLVGGGNGRPVVKDGFSCGQVFGDGSGATTQTYADVGFGSRFFYCAKVSPAERAGSRHPTLKPVDLCAYLAKLILPPERSDQTPIFGPCPACAVGKPLGDLLCCNGSGQAVVGWTVDRSPRRLLVPFCGAGSEIMGALRVGWEDVTGIEKEAESIADAHRRIAADAPLLNRVEAPPSRPEPVAEQLNLGEVRTP